MKQTFSRIEPRVTSANGLADEVISLAVCLVVTDEESGTSASRDAVIPLPEADPEAFIPFDELGEAWAMEIAERAASELGWSESAESEILTRLAKPKKKPFAWQSNE